MKRSAKSLRFKRPEKVRKVAQPDPSTDPSIPIPGLQMARALDIPEALYMTLIKILEEYPKNPKEKIRFLIFIWYQRVGKP